MKISIVYDNYLISTKLSQTIKAKDLVNCLNNFLSNKLNVNPKNKLTLISETQEKIDENESINIENSKDKKFYLSRKVVYKKKVKKELEPIEDLIMKVTEAKTKLKKRNTIHLKNLNARTWQERGDLFEQMRDNLNLFQSNMPGLQTRTAQLNQLTSILGRLMDQEGIIGNIQIQQGGNNNTITTSFGLQRNNQTRSIRPQQIIPDENLVKNLTEMGFAEDRSRRALALARNNISRATDLLINDELDYMPTENDNNSNYRNQEDK